MGIWEGQGDFVTSAYRDSVIKYYMSKKKPVYFAQNTSNRHPQLILTFCEIKVWFMFHACQGYLGYFCEPHWKSMGLTEISRETWQLWCSSLQLRCCMQFRVITDHTITWVVYISSLSSFSYDDMIISLPTFLLEMLIPGLSGMYVLLGQKLNQKQGHLLPSLSIKCQNQTSKQFTTNQGRQLTTEIWYALCIMYRLMIPKLYSPKINIS